MRTCKLILLFWKLLHAPISMMPPKDRGKSYIGATMSSKAQNKARVCRVVSEVSTSVKFIFLSCICGMQSSKLFRFRLTIFFSTIHLPTDSNEIGTIVTFSELIDLKYLGEW